MSIPAMSCGIAVGTAVTLSKVAADDSWCEVSINDPRTAVAPIAAPTAATPNRRCHLGASGWGRLRSYGVLATGRGM